jgi:hypothetical protein
MFPASEDELDAGLQRTRSAPLRSPLSLYAVRPQGEGQGVA